MGASKRTMASGSITNDAALKSATQSITDGRVISGPDCGWITVAQPEMIATMCLFLFAANLDFVAV